MKEVNKIQLILEDFKPFIPNLDNHYRFISISTGNYNPPAYIVEVLLLKVFGFENYGSMDKVLWHIYLKYKNIPFVIRDYKFGSWTIEGLQGDQETLALADEIKQKIIRASKLLDKVLQGEMKDSIRKGTFYLFYIYYRLSSLYIFYERRVMEAVKAYDECKNNNKVQLSNFAEHNNILLEKNKIIGNYCFALLSSFFSYWEFLLDVIFVFEQKDMEFSQFRKKYWNERFKLVFPIDNNKELKGLYDALVDLRNNYRNPFSHGLTNEANFLVPFDFGCSASQLVPLSYEYLNNKVYFGLYPIEREDALNIMDKLKKALFLIEEKNLYRYYMLYLTYGFPIPVNYYEISKIKKNMFSYEEFENYLKDRAAREDMLINRDF